MSPQRPLTLVVDGRTLISRAGIAERSGASMPTAKNWFAKRLEQPEEFRHPDKAATVDRTDYYDLEQFDRFHAWLKQSKQDRVKTARPELHQGDPDDVLSINEAAHALNYASASAIRKYLKDNPGYFPEPCGTVEGPSGRPIPAFRRGDLQDFDRRRTGDNTGVSGRISGGPGGVPAGTVTPEVAQRIATATEHLQSTGGYRHGVAAELAQLHGGSEAAWQRAVRQARQGTTALSPEELASARDRRVATALARLQESGYHRGLASELATEHDEPARTWQTAVTTARQQLAPQ
ncbi:MULTISPECIES: hypothetical protein [unclassified Streptomyces]|uniref:hypothetical protein n=1 Tax=unclassified Streptomyces TaxID=2593676 RepID=UPI000DB9E762|nr:MULTISPECIES: hypothetical protein [unclassified Streptomyces]MYT68371.1 hypothetical protein [Streptomyces sp. SID8367]RAJ77008.1 hypothetical protein K377_06177 [Streptomyces sp. PsTaAH-137]